MWTCSFPPRAVFCPYMGVSTGPTEVPQDSMWLPLSLELTLVSGPSIYRPHIRFPEELG